MLQPNNKIKLHASKSDNFEDISNQHIMIDNLINKNRSQSTKYSKKLNESNDDIAFIKKDSQEELFDPSMIFVGIHNCYYWDTSDRIRKGKIFLTKTELLFKCSRMPFVRVRLLLKDIEDIVKVKNYKGQYQSVLSIQCSNNKTYSFYKFRLPKKLIKNFLLTLIKDAQQMSMSNEFVDYDVNENLKTYKIHLRKLGKSVTDLKNIIKTPKMNQKSNSNSDLVDDDKVEALTNGDYLTKSASTNFLDKPVVFRHKHNDDEEKRSSQSSSFKKRTMRRIKSNSKDFSGDINFTPDLEADDKRKSIFIKHKNKHSPRPSSINSTVKEPSIDETEEVYGTKNIITINNSNPNETKRESVPSLSITSFGSSVQSMVINQFNAEKPKETLSRETSTESNKSQESDYSSQSETDFNSKNRNGSFKKESNQFFNNEFVNNENNNSLRSNFLIIFFLIAILIYSLMTILNFIKLCLLESSIKFDL